MPRPRAVLAVQLVGFVVILEDGGHERPGFFSGIEITLVAVADKQIHASLSSSIMCRIRGEELRGGWREYFFGLRHIPFSNPPAVQ